jgi:hypothetical protein
MGFGLHDFLISILHRVRTIAFLSLFKNASRETRLQRNGLHFWVTNEGTGIFGVRGATGGLRKEMLFLN